MQDEKVSPMLRFLTAYVCTTTINFVTDLIWINHIAHDMYMSGMGPILRDSPNILFAVVFYVVYAVGLVVFAVDPALRNNRWRTALLFGALFGFFNYATYDLTNLATLNNFPVPMALVDMVWGTVLSGFSATTGFFVARHILRRLQQ